MSIFVTKGAPASGDSVSHFNDTVSALDGAGLVFGNAYSSAINAVGAPTGYAGYPSFDGHISFTGGTAAGTPADIDDGDTIIGVTSGASATVLAIVVTSGSWAGDDAAGDIYLSGITGGPFQSEGLKIVTDTVATTDGVLDTSDTRKIEAQIRRDDGATGDVNCGQGQNFDICNRIGYSASIDGATFPWWDDLASAGGQMLPNIEGLIQYGALSSAITTGFLCFQVEVFPDQDVIDNHASYVTGWTQQKLTRISAASSPDGDVLNGLNYSFNDLGYWFDGPDGVSYSSIPTVAAWARLTVEVDIENNDVDVWVQRTEDSTATKTDTDYPYGTSGGPWSVTDLHISNNSSGHDDAVLESHDVRVGYRHWIVWTSATADAANRLGESSIG